MGPRGTKCLYNETMTSAAKSVEAGRGPGALREACRLSGARWAAWLVYADEQWLVRQAAGLTAKQRKALRRLVAQEGIRRWLAGGVSSRRVRTRRLPVAEAQALGVGRVAWFPLPTGEGGLLVGGEGLTKASEGIWRLTAHLWPGDIATSEDDSAEQERWAVRELMRRIPAYAPLAEAGLRLLRIVTQVLPADWAYVALREEGRFVPLAGLGLTVDPLDIREARGLPQQSTWLSDRDVFDLAPKGVEGRWLHLALRVPGGGGREIGVIALGRRRGGFTATEVERLQRLGGPLTETLDRLHTYQVISRQLTQVTLLNEVTVLLARSPDLLQAVRHLVPYLRRVFHAERVLVLLSEGEALVDLASGGQPRYSWDDPLWGRTFREGRPRQQAVADGQALAVPIRLRGQPIGVMGVIARQKEVYSERDERLLQSLANHFALFLEVHRLSRDLAQQVRLLQQVQDLAESIVGLTDEAEIAQRTAERLVTMFEGAWAGVLWPRWKEDELVELVVGGAAGLTPGPQVGEAFEAVSPLLRDALTQGRLIYVPGPLSAERGCRRLNPTSASMIYVPLKGGGEERPLGLIYLERRHALTLEPNEALVLEALAELLSSVLLAARRYQQLQRYVDHLGAVWETAWDLGANLEMTTLLQRAVHRVRQLLGAKGAEMALVDAEEQVVRIVVSETPWPEYAEEQFPLGEGVTGQAAATGKPVLVTDFKRWRRRHHVTFDAPFRSAVSVPLRYENETLGVITAYDDRVGFFDEEDVRLLQMLAQPLAVAVRNAGLYRELEERIQRQQEAEQRLIQSNRLAAVGELAAGVAHELNNPLTTVVGFAELVLEDLPADAPWREDIELILKEARRARGIVRSLLKLAHPISGSRVLSDLHELLDEVLELVQHLMRSQAIVLYLDYYEDLPMVEVAPGEIKQVFQNLIHNAIQAMPYGGELSVCTRLETRRDVLGVSIDITDTGKGIPPEVLPRIFEPFFTTKEPGQGTGLGLSVCYSIVQRHGGEITVESEEGRGSRFTVWLPLTQPEGER